jgi:hypothetical protein
MTSKSEMKMFGWWELSKEICRVLIMHILGGRKV